MPVIKENVIKIFQLDTFIMAGADIERQMRTKHGWTREQFNEYFKIYWSYLANLDASTQKEQETAPISNL